MNFASMMLNLPETNSVSLVKRIIHDVKNLVTSVTWPNKGNRGLRRITDFLFVNQFC